MMSGYEDHLSGYELQPWRQWEREGSIQTARERNSYGDSERVMGTVRERVMETVCEKERVMETV